MITRSGEARGEHMIMGYWPLEQPVFHDHKAERAERRLAGSITTVIMGIWLLGHGAPSPKWPPRGPPSPPSPTFHGGGGHRPGQTGREMPRQREKWPRHPTGQARTPHDHGSGGSGTASFHDHGGRGRRTRSLRRTAMRLVVAELGKL